MRSIFNKHFMNSVAFAPDTGSGAGGGDGGAGAGAGSGAGGDSGSGGGGQQQDNGPWYANSDYGFDDDTRKFFEGKNYPDAKTALSSLRHADQVARDRNVLQRPDPAKMKEWDGWEQLGWKKDVKDYTVKKPELKQGQVLDEAMHASFTQDAHDLRIPLDAANELFSRQFGKAYERIDAMTAAGAQSQKDLDSALRGEWGDKYDVNVDLSKRAMRAFGIGMDDASQLEQIIGSPGLVKMFHGMAERIGEDNLVLNKDGGDGGAHPATIEAELNRFEQDPANIAIMKDERHPLYAQTIERRRTMIGNMTKAQSRRGG